jgi:hypothetical protein
VDFVVCTLAVKKKSAGFDRSDRTIPLLEIFSFLYSLPIQNAIRSNAVTSQAGFSTQYMKTLNTLHISEITDKNATKMTHHPRNKRGKNKLQI